MGDVTIGVLRDAPARVTVALKSTIFKVALQVADMERGYYADHALTIARHPSETDERMMLRVLAFALHAGPDLAFGKGLSTDDEPDLWQRDLTGAIGLWIDVGQPDEKLLRRACGRARQVVVYAYGRGVDLWWDRSRRGSRTGAEPDRGRACRSRPARPRRARPAHDASCNARSRTGMSGWATRTARWRSR